jgi:pilus assembly protein Flp/PilA
MLRAVRVIIEPEGVDQMFATLKNLVRDESGATAIEYGLIAALVSVAAVGALTSLGSSLSTMFDAVSNTLSNAVGGATTP